MDLYTPYQCPSSPSAQPFQSLSLPKQFVLSRPVTNGAMISEQSNKENIPPLVCNDTKKGKNPIIPHGASSFKNSKVTKRKHKRTPLSDITHLFNNSATSTFILARDRLNGISAPPSALISRSRTPAASSSKKLRMGFR